MSDANGVARDQLRAFIERIERLEEEKKSISDDIKDVYGEAKGMGFIPAMMKKVIALRKKDEMQRMEEEAILDTYLHALGMIQADLFEEPKQQATPHDPETGEILEDINPRLAKQVVDGMQTEAGRAALIAAVDILIEQEEAEESRANVDEGAADESAAVSDDPASRTSEDSERQRASMVGFADDCRTGGKEQLAAAAAPVGEADVRSLPANFKTDAAISRPGIASLGRPEIENRSDKEAPEAGASGGMQDEIAIHPATNSDQPLTGGDHEVTNSAPHAPHTLNNRLDGVAVQSVKKPLRPLCQNPGDHCGGYGSHHCSACLRAAKETEVAA